MVILRPLLTVFLLQLLLLPVFSQDDLPEFNKMRVKELKKLLDERGVDCPACVEKEHLVNRIKETYLQPVLSDDELLKREEAKTKPAGKQTSSDGNSDDPKKKKYDDADMQKLMDELKKSGAGFENFKMYTPDDLKKYDLNDFDKGKYSKDFKKGARPKEEL